jgi:hypothetical protein
MFWIEAEGDEVTAQEKLNLSEQFLPRRLFDIVDEVGCHNRFQSPI